MEISASDVMALRKKTGVGMMDCKKALNETGGDVEKAISLLREKGIATAQKRSGRSTNHGYIATYVHPGSRLATMVEVDCETDFVARSDDFQKFASDIAMHITATNPVSISEEDIDPAIIEQEKEIYRNQALNEGKKPEFVDKIIEGRLKKFYAESCLLNQIFVRDETGKLTVQDMLNDLIAKIGENVVINRFVRYEIGS